MNSKMFAAEDKPYGYDLVICVWTPASGLKKSDFTNRVAKRGSGDGRD